MKKLNSVKLAAVGLALAFTTGTAAAEDLVAGQQAFEKFACASCHGADGKTSTMPSYPVLAGQHADYLLHALRSYKRGATGSTTVNARNNAVMTAMVQQLSEADMVNISAWLASLPSDLGVRR
ncbi:MAG TPA: cytochrome c [Burkholderiaceae bacterium]|nr:cytochrome c [Burkholderiaceae bacterium]